MSGELLVIALFLLGFGLSYWALTRDPWVQVGVTMWVHKKAPYNVRPSDYKWPIILKAGLLYEVQHYGEIMGKYATLHDAKDAAKALLKAKGTK